MLVDVVELRLTGMKLERDELKPAVRGELTIDNGDAYLHGPGLNHHVSVLLPSLRSCQVTRIRGESMIIIGTQDRTGSWETARHPQAWWCRAVTA